MKKIVLCWMLFVSLLCMCSSGIAAYDERLPDGVNAILSGKAWNDYEVTEVDADTEQRLPLDDVVAAVLSKGDRNVLCLFTKASGEWKLVVKREKALYAGKHDVRLFFPDQKNLLLSYEYGDGYDAYCFSPHGKNKERWTMEWAQIVRNVDDYPQPMNTYRVADVLEIKPTGDGLSYRAYHEDTGKPDVITAEKTIVRGVIYTDLDEFNIYSFPKSLKKAREKLTQPPTLPVNTQRDALPKGKTGSFHKDEKYPVFSGPSEAYWRAANGKASVSTNDWIQIFGCENDMVLIQYAISSEKSRFGYIPAEAVKDQRQLEILEPAYLPANISKACSLTDDPMKSKGETARLQSGETVRYLATFGDSWTYVETVTQPPMRGFVPSEAVVIAE